MTMMKRIMFIGGGDYRKDELKEVDNIILKLIDKEKDLFLMVPFATKEEKYDKWFSVISTHFKEKGLKNFDILKDDIPPEDMLEKVKKAKIIFFTGGRPEVLIEKLKKYGLVDEIKGSDAILLGYSAGALAFCKDCVITKDEDYPETLVIEGLGLVSFSVSVHYEDSQDEELLPLSEERKIYGITEGSAIFYNWEYNNEIVVEIPLKLDFIGEVYVFEKGKKEVVSD